MSVLVVDASVVIPWFHSENEPEVESCLRLYRDFQAGRVNIVVPELIRYEFSNFAALRAKAGPYPMESLTNFLYLDLKVAKMESEDFEEIARTAAIRNLTAYDAAYYYIAEKLEIPLYTADKELARAWGNRPGGHIRNYHI